MSEPDDRDRRQPSPVQQSYATRAAQRRNRTSSPLSNLPLPRVALIAGAVVLGLIILWLAFGRGADPSTSTVERPSLTVPTAGPPIPTATPIPTTAAVTGLGTAPGRLHELPAFNTPPLSLVLKDGDQVLLLDREKKDDAGNLWQLVAVGDYVGWIPDVNLAAPGEAPLPTEPVATPAG